MMPKEVSRASQPHFSLLLRFQALQTLGLHDLLIASQRALPPGNELLPTADQKQEVAIM